MSTNIRNLLPAITELVNDEAVSVSINYQPKFRPGVGRHLIVQAQSSGSPHKKAFVPVFYDESLSIAEPTLQITVQTLLARLAD